MILATRGTFYFSAGGRTPRGSGSGWARPAGSRSARSSATGPPPARARSVPPPSSPTGRIPGHSETPRGAVLLVHPPGKRGPELPKTVYFGSQTGYQVGRCSSYLSGIIQAARRRRDRRKERQATEEMPGVDERRSRGPNGRDATLRVTDQGSERIPLNTKNTFKSYSFVDKLEGRKMNQMQFRGHLQRFARCCGKLRTARLRKR